MASPDARVDELVARGGWTIGDAQARHAATPDTFWLPSADQLAQLVPGTMVRALFDLVDQADPVVDGVAPYDDLGRPNLVVNTERMWLWVESVPGSTTTPWSSGCS